MNAAGVYLCFLQGAGLPDPSGVLCGSGKVARNVRLMAVGDFARPEVEALINVAIANSRVPYDANRSGRFYVKSVSAKKRPRRKQ
jgi:hypothetical protein